MSNPPAAGLDQILQNQTRLTVLAFLSGCQQAEFGAVRDYCGVSDATLSKYVSRFAVYITVRNSQILLYPTSWHLQRACTRSPYAHRHG